MCNKVVYIIQYNRYAVSMGVKTVSKNFVNPNLGKKRQSHIL